MILDRPSVEERRIVIKQCDGPVDYLRCLWPRRCFLTGKCLFMRRAVRVSRIFTFYPVGDKINMVQHFWLDSKEFFLISLGKQ